MKKFLFSALLAMPFVMNAQTTITFEDLTLTQDSFWNGSDSTGQFVSGGASFGNSYNFEYGFWSGGYAYSNMRNDSTAGPTNMYSAIPAKGANNSANYAVFTPDYGNNGFINFGQSALISKLSLTNTTYAYLSMLNGDSFAKKFGDTLNADGVSDGTNGKDFFFVRIYAVNAADVKTDSLDVYLADYRFANTADNYILNTWKEVTLNFTANKLTFALFSSDNGQYGMNTPAFFALDNIEYSAVASVNALTKSNISIYPNPTTEQLNITGYTGQASIYATNGTLIQSVYVDGTTTINVSDLNEGLYLLVTESGSVKFLKK